MSCLQALFINRSPIYPGRGGSYARGFVGCPVVRLKTPKAMALPEETRGRRFLESRLVLSHVCGVSGHPPCLPQTWRCVC